MVIGGWLVGGDRSKKPVAAFSNNFLEMKLRRL